MKKLVLLFAIAVSFHSFAQMAKSNLPKPGVINGKVVDGSTNEPLPYVNVIVMDMAKQTITGGITEENGEFKIKDIPKGKSLVQVQFMGFETYTTEITVSSKNKKIDLGTISLKESTAQLDEVVVRAETSTVIQKVDRKVITVGKDLTAAGTTASELLNNVQSVSVDQQTGNLSLRGNSNVIVLVDGRPTNIPTAQLLRQLPSNSIKSIELITNPSAKYNPDGNSGIINIILNKNANMGFNGSLDTGITWGRLTRYNASTNMNYKTGKVNFFMNYGYNGGDNFNRGFVERPGVNRQDFIFVNDNQSHLLKLGADIYINDKNTLSFYTTQNWFDGFVSGSSRITDLMNNGNLLIDAPNSQDLSFPTETYNLNYKIDFDKKGHNLELEATYSNTNGDNFQDNADNLDPTSINNFFNDIVSQRDNTQINLDYTNPISEKSKIELGLEYRGDNTDNTNLTNQEILTPQLDMNGNFVLDGNGNPILIRDFVGSSTFDFQRDIYSGYFNYATSFKKFDLQLGARFESFLVDGVFDLYEDDTFNNLVDTQTVDQNLFNVYPSAFLTYRASEKNTWQVSYSRRIDRPGIQQVNPIREFSTPFVTSIGNANLLPQFTNSFELNYTRVIKGGNLTFGTFYRKIDDVISRITFADPADPNDPPTRQILTFTNFSDTDVYGVEFSANFRMNKWWTVNSSMDFYSQEQFGNIDNTGATPTQVTVQNNVFNARINNNFKASKRLTLQLFAMYRGPQRDIQWDVGQMWMMNAGGSWTVLKGKGTVNFRINDIFRGMFFQFDTNNPFTQNGEFYWESRTAFLGFNYRFGGGKNRAKQRRRRDNNEKQGGGGFF
jgi:outer membrane receptor protein involved in Fe transport